MKLSFCLLLQLALIQLGAQSVDDSWFPRIGVSYLTYQSFDNSIANLPDPDFGLDQVWDYTGYVLPPVADTINYLAAEDGIFADSFPQSEIVKSIRGSFVDWEWYYRVSGDTLYEDGLASIFIPSQDTSLLVHQPESSVVAYDGFALGDTLWKEPFMRINHQFMGTGTVTTDEGTYENCILIKEEAPNVGTGAVTFRWFHQNLMKEVLYFVPEYSDHPFAVVQWMVDYADDSSSTKESEEEMGLAFTYEGGNLYIINEGLARSVQIYGYDFNGRMLQKMDREIVLGRTLIEVDWLGGQPSGVYPILLVDEESGEFMSYKLIWVK